MDKDLKEWLSLIEDRLGTLEVKINYLESKNRENNENILQLFEDKARRDYNNEP